MTAPRIVRRTAQGVVAALLLAVCASPSSAHPLAPALLELRELPEQAVQVTWRQSSFRLPGMGEKRPILPEHCSALTTATVTEEAASITAVWTVDCGTTGLVNQRLGIEGLADARTDALIRVQLRDGRVVRDVVGGNSPYMTVPARESRVGVARGYAGLGIEHIATGIDHLLFVFGLLLLAATTRSLIATITAFTLGHSVTLSMAMLGIARVPSGPIEVLIAASVFLLGVELARGPSRGATLLGRYPWAMAASFGLLHGLGFAGALREIGLPEHEIALSLFAFNVGIEIGQLAFVSVILVVRWAARSAIDALPENARLLPVYAMGSLAALWMIERSVALLG